jgi:hypothetical protein
MRTKTSGLPLDSSFCAPAARLELVLTLADGRPWRLSVATGMDRFIGYYPHIEGFGAAGALLEWVATDARGEREALLLPAVGLPARH